MTDTIPELTPEQLLVLAQACIEAAIAANAEGDHEHANDLRFRRDRLHLRARELWIAECPLVMTEPRLERERRFGIIAGDTP